MSVVKPTPFVPAMLVSTTATDSTPLWSSAVNYLKDAKVRHERSIYISLAHPNENHSPTAADANSWWYRVGPDNIHAMFDDAISTPTLATGSLTTTLSPGICNSVAFFGLQGQSITVTVRDGSAGPVVYTKTLTLDGTILGDWYQYFFEPYVQLKELVITDLPPYASAHTTAAITGGGEVGVGTMVTGTVYDTGKTLMGVGLPTEDYSRVETDEFGTTRLTRRTSAKRITLQTIVPRQQLRKVYQVLDDLRATPAVWLVSRLATDSPATALGVLASWQPVIAHPDTVTLSIEIKGMT